MIYFLLKVIRTRVKKERYFTLSLRDGILTIDTNKCTRIISELPDDARFTLNWLIEESSTQAAQENDKSPR